ncbi:MAG: hypothetical protein AB1630_11665 [bacterium]
MKGLVLIIIVGSILIGCSHYQLKREDTTNEKKDYIIGTWRAEGGIWITFEKNGFFHVDKGKEGKERVFDGEYSVEYAGGSPHGLIFECIALKVKINNPEVLKIEPFREISIVPVSFYLGEGDPCGLKLLQLGNSFGHLLAEYFGINTQEPLMLSGECVYGGWPSYLEEAKQ